MKNILRVLIIIVLTATITQTARAVDVTQSQANALEINKVGQAVPQDARDLLGDLDVLDTVDAEGVITRILNGVTSKLREIVTGALSSAVIIVVAAIFSGVFNSAFPTGGNYATLAGVLAISAASIGSVNTFIGVGSRVLDDLAAFSRVLLPCLTAAATASGAVTSAAVKYAATALFLDILSTLMRAIVMPLIYAFCAVTVAEAAVGGEALSGASSLLKWLVKSIMSVFVILFILYMAIAGVISSAADAVAVRAAKVTISTVLPVVGSILADAADTVLSGAAFVRNAVGVFGVLAVTATCAVPFLRLGVNYLLFKAAGGLSAAVSDSRVTKLVNGFSAALGMTLGVVGINAVTLFVSIVSVIKTVA